MGDSQIWMLLNVSIKKKTHKKNIPTGHPDCGLWWTFWHPWRPTAWDELMDVPGVPLKALLENIMKRGYNMIITLIMVNHVV